MKAAIYPEGQRAMSIRMDAERLLLYRDAQARMMKAVATLALLLMALIPAAAAPTPAVKSAQCPPGHMVSGGYCTPMFRVAPTTAPKVRQCRSRLTESGTSYCLEMRRR